MSMLVVDRFLQQENTGVKPINTQLSLNRFPWFLFFILLVSGFAACIPGKNIYRPDRLIPPQQLQEDANVLWKTLQQCHPSLYWYTPKDSLDNAFEQMILLLNDSLTESQFRFRLSAAIALIHCGHTSIRSSDAAVHYREKNRKPFFPLQVKTWGGDSMAILANAYRNDSILKRGTTIQFINGKSVSEIIDTMSRFISADGLHNSFKYQLISNNFPAWYQSIIGLVNVYHLDITTLAGLHDTINVKSFDPVYQDSIMKAFFKANQKLPGAKPKRTKHSNLEDDRKLTIDSARNLAVMELNTFSHAHLPRFFRQSFKKLRKNKINNLAIELRENGGGNIMNSIKLDRYLSKHPFKVADTVFAKSFKYPYPHLLQNGWIYKFQSWFVTSRRSDGNLHYRLYEKKYFKPFVKNHFDGKVFVITGGFTFSASTLFITPLRKQENVLVLGEETGGSAYGNTAVNVPELRLPNTGLRIRIPLYRLVIDKTLPHDGRGIIPDIEIPPSSWYLAHKIDPKMEKIYELIKAEKPALKTAGKIY